MKIMSLTIIETCRCVVYVPADITPEGIELLAIPEVLWSEHAELDASQYVFDVYDPIITDEQLEIDDYEIEEIQSGYEIKAIEQKLAFNFDVEVDDGVTEGEVSEGFHFEISIEPSDSNQIVLEYDCVESTESVSDHL